MNRQPFGRPWITLVLLVATARGGVADGRQVVVPPTLGVPAASGSKPSPAYDMALAALVAGNVSRGLELATREYQGATRIGNQRWIDSIAAAALVGECRHEAGDFAGAIAAYDEALALATQHADWLLSVQFPPLPPQPADARRAATWGRSTRGTSPARLPDQMPFRWQAPDPEQVLKRGGVLAATFDQPVRAQEIMRSLVIALYRRGEILGDLGRDATVLDGVAKALARRPAPPNHYSQSWVSIALGTALWSQGDPEQAAALVDRGLTIGQGLDHALTAWGLIVLGRIALDADRAADAARLFEEATLVAAEFGDARAIEEAFRFAFAAHMLAGTRGVPATIRAASESLAAGEGLDVLRGRLAAMRAEALAIAGDPRSATAALREIDPRLLRGEAGRGPLGAQAAYAAALAAFASGDVATGDADLGQALGLARQRSTRLFQMNRLAELLRAGANLSDRRAEALWSGYLAPPSARDFGLDPLDALAMISAPRRAAFDAWIAVAVRRGLERGDDAVLDPVEAARRDRWLEARPLGGRLTSAQRLLTADPDSLDAATAARRAALVAKVPDLGPLLDRLTRERSALTAAALAAAGPVGGPPREPPGGPETWAAYRGSAESLARHVAALAAGREAVTIDFPPLTPAAEIRRRLADRQLILSFHWTSGGLTGVLESRDRFAIWEVRQAAALQAELVNLARGLCLFDPQAVVGTDRLLSSDWRGPAGRIERILFENSRISLAEGVEELVIVPDGRLWYLPFELLPIASARGDALAPRPLGEVCRIRYCPTRSLAVDSFVPRRLAGPVGIHAGRMSRGDDAEAVAATLARATAAIDRAVPVIAGGNAPAAAASIFDALALFDETVGAGPAACLVPPAAGRGGIAFAEWLAPPVKRPAIVVVPGMQTAMAGGLQEKSLPTWPGDDVALPALDLIAAGARTAVLSRWRVGGATCVELVTEFLREATADDEAPLEPPAQLWRRAVDVVTAECPDLEREPRLRRQGDDGLADSRHPFLWAGYLLVDTGAGRAPPRVDAPPAAAQPDPVAPPLTRPAAGNPP